MSRPGEARRERCRGAQVWRMPLKHRRVGVIPYLVEHIAFAALAAVFAGALHLWRRYDLVQVNTIPDSLVFAAVIPRLLGARVLLDLHECVPEFLATRLNAGANHPAVRVAAYVEQASIKFADSAITCTEQMREVFSSRGAPSTKIGVVLNSADERIFDVTRHPPRPRRPDRFTIISHGSLEERYGIDTIIRALSLLRDELPELRLAVFGEGSYRDALTLLAQELAVEDRVDFSRELIPLDSLVEAIADADAGVVASKRDAFRDLTHTNKMFEFIAMRRVLIVSRTRAVEAYFDESCFQYFDADDEHDLARAIREVHADPDLGDRLVRRASEVSESYRWKHQREIYRSFVETILADRPQRR